MLGLRGRPDYLVEEIVDGRSRLHPLEVKPSRRSARLFESDATQVDAHLMRRERPLASERRISATSST